MSLRPDNTLISNREMLLELVSVPFRTLVAALGRFGSSTARAQTLREIAAIPDEALQAKGLTRSELVALAFRHDG